MSESENTTPFGREHPWEEREAGLPSDLQCERCGGCIESEDQCFELRRGFNDKAEFHALNTPQRFIFCLECGKDIGQGGE